MFCILYLREDQNVKFIDLVLIKVGWILFTVSVTLVGRLCCKIWRLLFHGVKAASIDNSIKGYFSPCRQFYAQPVFEQSCPLSRDGAISTTSTSLSPPCSAVTRPSSAGLNLRPQTTSIPATVTANKLPVGSSNVNLNFHQQFKIWCNW